jgi:hypothetical protein
MSLLAYKNISGGFFTVELNYVRYRFDVDEIKHIPLEKNKYPRFLVQVKEAEAKKALEVKKEEIKAEVSPDVNTLGLDEAEEKEGVSSLFDSIKDSENTEIPDYFPEEYRKLEMADVEVNIERPLFNRLNSDSALEFAEKLSKYYDNMFGTLDDAVAIPNASARRTQLIKIAKRSWEMYELDKSKGDE